MISELPTDFKPKNQETKVSKLETSIIWIEEGICCIKFLPKIERTVENAKSQISFLESICLNNEPIIVDVRESESIGSEIREVYKNSSFTETSPALAFIVDSFFSKILANTFVRITFSKYQVKMFNEPSSAFEWIKQYSSN